MDVNQVFAFSNKYGLPSSSSYLILSCLSLSTGYVEYPLSDLLFTIFFIYIDREKYPLDGWHIYDAQTEYKRQGFDERVFRVSQVNRFYQMCPTYPEVLLLFYPIFFIIAPARLC